MKKHSLWLSVLLAAVLLCAPAAFTGCNDGKDPDKKPDPKPPVAANWSITQVGGAEDGTLTTHIKVTFRDQTESLALSEFVIGGAAHSAVKVDFLTGEPLTEGSGFEKQGGYDFIIPVSANYTGDATVALNKVGATAVTQSVKIFGKLTLPEKANPLNYKKKPASYTGTPLVDPLYPEVTDTQRGSVRDGTLAPAGFPAPNSATGQLIPGKVMCGYYDNGGNNIAFKDNGRNEGSDVLQANQGYRGTYFGDFRRGTPTVDTSFLKGAWKKNADNTYYMNRSDANIVDFHQYSKIFIPDEWENMIYVGWTNSGEWFRITVDVQTTGLYEVRLMYTNPGQNTSKISLDFDPEAINNADVTAGTSVECELTSTYDAADKCSWGRNPHHWNNSTVACVYLEQGQSVLTVRLQNSGGLNLGFADFSLIG